MRRKKRHASPSRVAALTRHVLGSLRQDPDFGLSDPFDKRSVRVLMHAMMVAHALPDSDAAETAAEEPFVLEAPVCDWVLAEMSLAPSGVNCVRAQLVYVLWGEAMAATDHARVVERLLVCVCSPDAVSFSLSDISQPSFSP